MRVRIPAIVLITVVALLSGCASYTARDAMDIIAIPEQDPGSLAVTKHSLIVAEREAEEARQEEASARETVILLQEEIGQLEQIIQAYEGDDTVTQLQQIIEERGRTIDELRAGIEQLKGELKALQAERQTLMAQVENADQVLDTQKRIEAEAGQLRADLAALQAEYQRVVGELESAQSAIEAQQHLKGEAEQLKGELRALQEEHQRLESQLASANKALDAQQRLEAEAEQQRILEEQQRQAAYAKEQEALRLQEQAEAERRERERELARLIPPLSELTLPHRFITSDTAVTIAKGSTLNTILLPLSDTPWQTADMVESVATSIADLDYPVVFVTGAMENVTALVRRIGDNATLVEGGAIITGLEVIEATTHAIRVRLNGEQTLRLALANLVEHEVFASFMEGGDEWKEIQARVTPERLKTLLAIIRGGSIVEPTLLASSLWEPSHQDWSSFSPITYRQIDYLWPLSMAVEDEQFLDAYRVTHFSSVTDSGNTVSFGEVKERTDYIYSRKVLPLSSVILPVGGESAPRDGEVQRWAIAASFIVP